MVERVDIQNVLEQMRSLREQVSAPATNEDASQSQFANTVEQMRQQIEQATASQSAQSVSSNQQEGVTPESVMPNYATANVPSFGEMFKSAIDTVNQNQAVAKDLATRYETGDPKVDLPEVMIALQKSSVSFQAMTQVRNKMIEAYKEIINMPL